MLDIALILTTGLITGMAIGLFPVFPIYLGAFVLYATNGIWSPEEMLLFWAVASIGSQFFGSVSAITLGIPGDSSSLVYIDDVRKLNLPERNRLLWLTGRGSLVSGAASLLLVWLLYHVYQKYNFNFFSTIEVKITLLYAVLIGLVFSSHRRFWALALAALGIVLAPQNNYSLPTEWYHLSLIFQDTTFFMLVLGLLVLPDLLAKDLIKNQHNTEHAATPGKMPWWLVAKSTLVGCTVGLVPGPAAETATQIAYNLNKKKSISDRIVAAETANNPGVVMMLLPLLLLGLPFTASSLIVSNIMDGRMVNLIELAQQPSTLLSGLTVVDSLIILALIATAFYYLFSIKFINFYSGAVLAAHTHVKWILIVAVVAMIGMDMYIQEIFWVKYLTLSVFYATLGIVLKYTKVSPVPLIFIFLLGDQIIWTTIQFTAIYF